MTDKKLSEEIEQADAEEFVDYAKLLAEQIIHTPCGLEEYRNWIKHQVNFAIPFQHCLKHKESHIAAAIMLADASGWGSQISSSENPLEKKPCSARLFDINGYTSIHTTHSTREMALLVAIAKKLERE